jgi:hypothetical protein
MIDDLHDKRLDLTWQVTGDSSKYVCPKATNANFKFFAPITTLPTLQYLCSRRILVELHQVLHIVFAAEEYRASIMDRCRNYIKDSVCSCGSNTSSLHNIY